MENNVYLFLINVKITILATNLIGSFTNFLTYSMLYADFEFKISVPLFKVQNPTLCLNRSTTTSLKY